MNRSEPNSDWSIVEVDDSIMPTSPATPGYNYFSPPQPVVQALTLVRALRGSGRSELHTDRVRGPARSPQAS